MESATDCQWYCLQGSSLGSLCHGGLQCCLVTRNDPPLHSAHLYTTASLDGRLPGIFFKAVELTENFNAQEVLQCILYWEQLQTAYSMLVSSTAHHQQAADACKLHQQLLLHSHAAANYCCMMFCAKDVKDL